MLSFSLALLYSPLKLIRLNIHVRICMHYFMSAEVLLGFVILLTKKKEKKNRGAYGRFIYEMGVLEYFDLF